MFNNIEITLHYSVYMRTSGEKVRISDEAERVQPVSYFHKIIVRIIYSGVFMGRQARHLPRFACKYSSFLVKNFLSAYIIFSEPHHNSVLRLQTAPRSNYNV